MRRKNDYLILRLYGHRRKHMQRIMRAIGDRVNMSYIIKYLYTNPYENRIKWQIKRWKK